LTYTSGTTGVPKAVMLTHKNLISNFKATAEFLGLRDNDQVLGVLPFYHVMGIAFALTPLFSPASVVLLSEFIPKNVMTALMSHKITAFVSAPMAYTLLGSMPNHPVGPVSGLRFAVSGGAPLRREIHERFEQKFHIELLEGYGLSEATCVIAMNPPGGKRKIGSVGIPLPGVNIKVMNESGEQLKAGEIGELWVSGDSIMAGYLGDRAETRTAVRDGWLHTGDLGYCDADGYYFIEGRKKDLIIRGGENIYPREIEEILVRHPGVMEAAVIGISDWVWGEEVMAFVVPRPNAELTEGVLAEYCHHEMADYKSPRIWRILSEMPHSATGEVLKKRLFEIYQTGQD
jgi:long-chain acyl-CoA synthetase